MTFTANGVYQGQMEVLTENRFFPFLIMAFYTWENRKKNTMIIKVTNE